MFVDTRSQDASPLFAGVFFLLSGFDTPTQTQLSAALEGHGGVNVGEYDGSCTHIIVSRTFLWDDPVCAAARKDGKCLSTELWVSDCLDLGVIVDVNHVIYRPLREFEGIVGSKNLVVCLTGYQGQARRNVMRMVHLMGAHFSKPLIANRVTHLVCYKFEGEKFNLAKQLGLKMVNHQWLEDCLRTWALLSEEDYTKSGYEIELSEAEAKDSEDDGNLKSNSFSPEVVNGAVMPGLEGVREEVILQQQMDKVESDHTLEPCFHREGNDYANLSPHLLSAKEHVDTAVGDHQKTSNRDDFGFELEVEKRDEDLTSPLVLRAKKVKATGFPEIASNSKRQNLVNADENGDMIWEVSCEPKHHGERHPDEAVCDMELDRPDLGSSCTSEKVPKLTTPAKGNGKSVKAELAFRSPGSKKDKGTLSLTAQENRCNGEEENVSVAPLPSVKTPQTGKGKKHSTVLATGLDAVILEDNGRETTEGTENGIMVGNIYIDAAETEFTPKTCAKKKHNPLPPASKEQESLVKCGSASKSTEVRRPPKNSQNISARSSKLKVAEKTLCTDGSHVPSSSVKDSPPKSNIEKAVQNVKKGEDLRKGDKQTTPRNDFEEHACEMQVQESKLVNEVGYEGSHHRGNMDQPTKADAKVSGSKKQGKLQKKPKLKSAEMLKLLTTETVVLCKENAAETMNEEKTVDDTAQGKDLRRVADKQNTPCNQRSTANESTLERQGTESKSNEVCNMNEHQRGKLGQHANTDTKVRGTKKQGKFSKRLISTEEKRLSTEEKMVLDKENAVVCQSHVTKGKPRTSHEALAARKSHEVAVSTKNTSQKPNTSSQRCFALSGHRQEIKPLQALVKRLGGKLCRDSHQWSHQTTHLIIAGQLRRTEKLFAAAAAGRWILREDYLKDSSEAGEFLDEMKYEWHGTGMTKDGSISFEAPRKWRELRENTGCCALEGLRILLYGECIIPSLDTLRRALRAGGADLVATCPPYTKFLASKVDFAIVNPGTPRNDYWIQEFLNHSVACVTTDFFVNFVCKPSSSIDRHILYDTHHLVQILVTRLQAIDAGAKKEQKGGSYDAGAECEGEEICCIACGQSNREDVMLLCGDDNGSGCGTAMHIDCCKPPLDKVPSYDWYCVQCTKPPSALKKRKKKTASSKG